MFRQLRLSAHGACQRATCFWRLVLSRAGFRRSGFVLPIQRQAGGSHLTQNRINPYLHIY
jgi:hypothetical protein